MSRKLTTGMTGVATSVVILAALLLSWEVTVRAMGIPSYLVPTPSAIGRGFWRGMSSGTYLFHWQVTLYEIVLGFLFGSVLGFVLGTSIALSKTAAYFLQPYILVFQTIPKVALAPLILLWFGLGPSSKVVTAAISCFFPVMINVIAGLLSADKERIDLLRAMGASRWQIFRMLQLPNAGPYVFAGLEIAVTFAVIGAIVAEFLGADAGLGLLMQSMNFTMDVAGAFSIILLLSATVLVLSGIITLVRRRVLYWE